MKRSDFVFVFWGEIRSCFYPLELTFLSSCVFVTSTSVYLKSFFCPLVSPLLCITFANTKNHAVNVNKTVCEITIEIVRVYLMLIYSRRIRLCFERCLNVKIMANKEKLSSYTICILAERIL